MQRTYWLTYRIHDREGYERTYKERVTALHDELKAASGGGERWWFETGAFFYFTSEERLAQLLVRILRAIDESVDLVVIGCVDRRQGHVVGRLRDPSIFGLVPYLTQV